jgi:hypothetical protein
MVDIGINFIDGNEKCYEILKKYKFINTIKFPGRICDYENLTNFLKLAKRLELKVDLHGLPGMLPAFNCMNDEFLSNVDVNKLIEIFEEYQDISRFSTHIGIKHKDSLDNYTSSEVDIKWKENYDSLKNILKNIFNKDVEIGLENIPGGFMYDERTLTPEYVSQNWEKADFGVFDVCHAKLASKDLKTDYSQYIESLEFKDKVKIIHVSGNTDYNDRYTNKPDKHVLINDNEIEDIICAIDLFKNVDLIVSEYSFDSIYSEAKEIIIEAIVLNKIITTKDVRAVKQTMKYLRENLKDDITNIEEIIDKIQ